jgi:hypothetical protein
VILRAKYVNAEHTAAAIEVEGRGWVAINQADRPELWAEMLALGYAPDVYSPPIAPVPDISDRQFFHCLAKKGLISQEEALNAVKHGDIPAAFEQYMSHFGGAEFDARMLMAGAVTFERNHQLVNAFGSFLGLSQIDLDNLFRDAALL